MEVQADDRREAPTAEDVIGVGGVGHARTLVAALGSRVNRKPKNGPLSW
jgi:hypothetical protein